MASTSFPFLAIARETGHDYADVVRFAEYIDTGCGADPRTGSTTRLTQPLSAEARVRIADAADAEAQRRYEAGTPHG